LNHGHNYKNKTQLKNAAETDTLICKEREKKRRRRRNGKKKKKRKKDLNKTPKNVSNRKKEKGNNRIGFSEECTRRGEKTKWHVERRKGKKKKTLVRRAHRGVGSNGGKQEEGEKSPKKVPVFQSFWWAQ